MFNKNWQFLKNNIKKRRSAFIPCSFDCVQAKDNKYVIVP